MQNAGLHRSAVRPDVRQMFLAVLCSRTWASFTWTRFSPRRRRARRTGVTATEGVCWPTPLANTSRPALGQADGSTTYW